MFVGSRERVRESGSSLDPESIMPLPEEKYFTPDWTLPLTTEGQCYLLRKVATKFNKATAGIAINLRKRFRLSSDELTLVRNQAALLAQMVPYLESRLPADAVVAWQEEFCTGSTRDDDLKTLLDGRPDNIALSMLSSAREQAKREQDWVCPKPG